jgi:hypothetical protein
MLIPQDTAADAQDHRPVPSDQRFECSVFPAREVVLQKLPVCQIGD